MRYQQPYGLTDTNAPYINGNPAAGIQGSIPPAAAFEEPMREIVNMIALGGLTPNGGTTGVAGGDLQQLAKAVQAQKVNYAADTGSQNAMVAALSPALAGPTYPVGIPIRIKVAHSSINDATHASLTLDAGLGARNVKRTDGAMPSTNDLVAGGVYEFVFDGTNFQVVGIIASTGGGGTATYYVKIPYAADTSAVPNTITVAFSPAISAPGVGDLVLVKAANTVTGATQINVNAMAAAAVVRNDGAQTALKYGDVLAGGSYLLQWDGTEWVLINSAFGILSPSTAPFYPEILGNNGLMSISTAVGSVTITALQFWQWRGMRQFSNSANVVLNTVASKTYHLRWDAPGTGLATPPATHPYGLFSLRDLSDAAYNPSALNENEPNFDTTYDSMLVAKVVTDASNNPTVTALINKNIIQARASRSSFSISTSGATIDPITLNWSRQPQILSFLQANVEFGPGAPGWGGGEPGDEYMEMIGISGPTWWQPITTAWRDRYHTTLTVYGETDLPYPIYMCGLYDIILRS
jgi:hypothetical protein